MNWKEILTLMIAVAGATLGIINTWIQFRGNRVRLRIDATNTVTPPGPEGTKNQLSLTAVNLGRFPVRIRRIGLYSYTQVKIPLGVFDVSGKGSPVLLQTGESFV
jgi:hypothetical protein